MKKQLIVSLVFILLGSIFYPGMSNSVSAEVEIQGTKKQWDAYDREKSYDVVTERDVFIVMRDGTKLVADVHRPNSDGKFPVILTQTPYNKNGPLGEHNQYLVERGYVHVIVDVRGTGGSQGTWDSFGEAEQRDGYELVEWSAKQPWSDGNVGLWGASYMAINQLFTAAQQPPSLKAIFPIVPMGDVYRDILMSGGIMNTGFIPLWLGLVTTTGILPPTYTLSDPITATTTLLGHVSQTLSFPSTTLTSLVTGGEWAYDGPAAHLRSPIYVTDKIQVPTFVTGGLHDIFQRGEPMIYEKLKGRVPTKLLMGNWTHGDFGSGLPKDGVPTLDQIALRWFDHYLKGINTKVNKIPDVTQFLLGADQFVIQSDYPHPYTKASKWYLHQNGKLNQEEPGLFEKKDYMLQHQVNGICSGSTNQWLAGALSSTPCSKDNRLTELSEITFTTEAMEEDFIFSGPIAAKLFVSTTVREAIVSVRVTDVAPDGTSTEITAGWLAASFRKTDFEKSRYLDGELVQPYHPFTKESVEKVVPGVPMELNVEIFPTNAVIKQGHKLRVAVGPSDFPHSMSPIPQLLNQLGGIVTILHDRKHPSSIVLPVVE